MIDEIAEAVQLAGIRERLIGRWRFKTGESGSAEMREVDVRATSQSLVLGPEGLAAFCAISPEDPRVPDVNSVIGEVPALDPERIALILLCGGLGTRGNGKVHPLAQVRDPVSGCTRNLVGLQLDRVRRSPLAASCLLLFASPLNAPDLRRWVLEAIPDNPVRIYTGGVVPRMMPRQLLEGDPVIYRDALGRESLNPAGHMDAIRWLVVSGLLAELATIDVLVTASYSNLGFDLYDETMLSLAGYASQLVDPSRDGLMVAEAAAMPANKRTGSLLVERIDCPGDMRLVKYAYGLGKPRLPPESDILMSTNTLYFRVSGLLSRLEAAATELELSLAGGSILELISRRENHDIVAAVFDRAFSVEPYVTLKRGPDGTALIQAERDLDQLSLIGEQSPMRSVKVGPQRSFTIKHSEQLNDRAILDQLFT